MSLFTRKPKPPAPANTDPALLRFLTLGGATVTVTRRWNDFGEGEFIFPSRCLGCDWTGPDYSHVVSGRDAANKHASTCRAMPKPEAAS